MSGGDCGMDNQVAEGSAVLVAMAKQRNYGKDRQSLKQRNWSFFGSFSDTMSYSFTTLENFF